VEVLVSDAARLSSLLLSRTPFIVRNASASPDAQARLEASWSSANLASVVGEELVEISFANDKGELNTFEPMSLWQSFFDRNQYKTPPGLSEVLVRPIKKVLRVRHLLELLRTGKSSAAGVRGMPYLHQSELHFNLPALLPLVSEPDWVQAANLPSWLGKETNIWLSGGGTMTSLHQDTTENIMVQVRGSKEFLLFPPEQKDFLYYQSVQEVARDSRETGTIFVGSSGRGDSSNHGLVDVREPDLKRHPKYVHASGRRCRIDRGDALFVPGSWHHAVYSSCSEAERRVEAACNVGLNFWYVDTERMAK